MNRFERIAELAAKIYMNDNEYDRDDAIDAACDKLGEEIPNSMWMTVDKLTEHQIACEVEEQYKARCDSEASFAEWEMHFR
jgi:formylmethanofuran dehydrogenase subunit B